MVADLGGEGKRFSVWLRGKRRRPRRHRPPPPPSGRPIAARSVAGRYELIARLGSGSMGEVWAARDRRWRRNVALKVLHPELVDTSAEARVRFQREAMVLSKLRSPHVVELYDWGQDGRAPYIAMELVEGVDLKRVLEDDPRLPAQQVCILVSDIAQGLYVVHREGIIHRDLKPGNVVLCEQTGERAAKLVDFGVARPSVTAMAITGTHAIGTVHYMSPEQCSGSLVDHRTDLWSLAVIAYRCLTGKMPFAGVDMPELADCILNSEPLPPTMWLPSLPASVDAFFGRAFCKDPEGRFASALELAEALNAAVAPIRSGEHVRPPLLRAGTG